MERENVAVLLASYNGEKYIEEQINSILLQKLDCPFHLYIRDDGSTDGTVSILKQYLDREDVSVSFGENIGLTAGLGLLFSTALQSPKGYRYFSLADQDDCWMEDKLQTAIDALRLCTESRPALYAGCSYIADENLKITGTTVRKNRDITLFNSFVQNIAPGHSQVMNRELAELVAEKKDYSRIYALDYYIVNLAVACGVLLFDNTPHTLYRQHGGNLQGHRSNSLLTWMLERTRRLRTGEGHKIAAQMQDTFLELSDSLGSEERRELEDFLNSGKDFRSRLSYVRRSRLYRQSRAQTLIFKGYYLLGGYKK